MSAPQARASSDSGDDFDLTGALIGGKYRITGKLTDGGMSRIFLAHQTDLDRTVAVKVMNVPPTLRNEQERMVWSKRFRREAAMLACISHPNVIGVYEYGTTDEGLAYLVMEYAEGGTLAAYVRAQGFLNPPVALRIADQIASALEEAHSAGIIHRDLKPQNIVLLKNRSTRVKVLDFGLAKRLDQTPDDPEATQGNARLGSPRYMAPEQVSGEPVSRATDVYAFGCVLYFMLVGRPPFTASTSMELMAAHLSATPLAIERMNPLAKVSSPLSNLVYRCLSKKPADRFPTMSEMRRALALCPEFGGESAAQGSSGERAIVPEILEEDRTQLSITTIRANRARRISRVAVAVAGALAFLLAVWMLIGGLRPNDETVTEEFAASEPELVAAQPTASGEPSGETAPPDSLEEAAPEFDEQTGELVRPADRARPRRHRLPAKRRRVRTDNLNPWE